MGMAVETMPSDGNHGSAVGSAWKFHMGSSWEWARIGFGGYVRQTRVRRRSDSGVRPMGSHAGASRQCRKHCGATCTECAGLGRRAVHVSA